MEELVKVIQSVGFPTAVAAYLLFKGNKDQQSIKLILQKLTDCIERIERKLDKG